MKQSRGDKEYGPYQAYLIRLWPSKREGVGDTWVSLQNIATDDRQEFPILKQFMKKFSTLLIGGPVAFLFLLLAWSTVHTIFPETCSFLKLEQQQSSFREKESDLVYK